MFQPTGIVRDRRFLEHTMGSGHVESPLRLEAVYEMLDKDGPANLADIPARAATLEELAFIHDPDYIAFIERTSGRAMVVLDPDTAASARTWEAARLAAGGLLEASDAVLRGEVRNAFALVRPPGHHAEAGRAMGFCIFNNIALAAEHLVRRRGLKRVLIADWDLHHGNGTQHSFYERGDVLYFSTHQFPYYPGTGHWTESGSGAGAGKTVNIPLSPGKTDGDYLHIYRTILGAIARQFRPEFILVSAGFDIYGGDPLGGMDLSTQGFGALAAEIMALADEMCRGRLLFTLEGGYHLPGLRDGVKHVLLQLNGASPPIPVEASPSPATLREIAPAAAHLSRYWKLEACV
ncbi:MAG: histone deacetylase [Candidatus Aminicenantes bacterium]|nr:histone deacetylase [Candidatus Aminicenantes bacterium]